jgi:hypothetical protein
VLLVHQQAPQAPSLVCRAQLGSIWLPALPKYALALPVALENMEMLVMLLVVCVPKGSIRALLGHTHVCHALLEHLVTPQQALFALR